jgi:ketosteroid isomerase-like protein
MRGLIFTLFVLLTVSVFGQKSDEELIRHALNRQQDCWNKGDLECFMNGYWESDQLKFVGGSGVTYGYDATLERYQKGYPDRTAMGKLTFDIRDMERISGDAYSVVGKFHLARTIGDLQGYFTLLWRKIDGEWVIVMDHTSASE